LRVPVIRGVLVRVAQRRARFALSDFCGGEGFHPLPFIARRGLVDTLGVKVKVFPCRQLPVLALRTRFAQPRQCPPRIASTLFVVLTNAATELLFAAGFAVRGHVLIKPTHSFDSIARYGVSTGVFVGKARDR
jgi:hypothetical protein